MFTQEANTGVDPNYPPATNMPQQMKNLEDLVALRRKVERLQAERSSVYKMCKTQEKQNQQTIQRVKFQNKSYQDEIIEKVAIIDGRTKMNNKQLQSKMHTTGLKSQMQEGDVHRQKVLNQEKTNQKDIVQWRRRLDDLIAANKLKRQNLLKAQDRQAEQKALQVDNAQCHDYKNPESRSIKSLEAQLDKIMLNQNEALRVKKSFEAILIRLQDERKGYEHQLSMIENSLREKQFDIEALSRASHDAAAEIQHLKYELTHLNPASQLLAEQAEKERHSELLQDKPESEDPKYKVKSDSDNDLEQGEKDEFQINKDATNFDEKDFKKALEKIEEATGLDDMDEVLEKIGRHQETMESLSKAQNLAKEKLSGLLGKRDQLKRRLQMFTPVEGHGVQDLQTKEKEIKMRQQELERRKNEVKQCQILRATLLEKLATSKAQINLESATAEDGFRQLNSKIATDFKILRKIARNIGKSALRPKSQGGRSDRPKSQGGRSDKSHHSEKSLKSDGRNSSSHSRGQSMPSKGPKSSTSRQSSNSHKSRPQSAYSK